MHRYKNLIVLGTSHIAMQSIREVDHVIEEFKPKIIALELDKKRFLALLSKKRRFSFRDIKKMGLGAFLLNFIGAWAENKLGKIVHTKPGAEMKKAIELARKHRLIIALIDQDISITIKKLIKNITFIEKLKFIKDLIFSPLERKKIDFNLKKVPKEKIIEEIIEKVRIRYPSLYYALIIERNKIMAKNLNKLILKYPKKLILAVVGAGHVKGIIGELKLIQSKKQS